MLHHLKRLPLKFFRRFPNLPIEFSILDMLDCRYLSPPYPDSPTVYRIFPGSKKDIDLLDTVSGKRATFLARLSKGDRFLVAKKGDCFVGYLWYSTQSEIVEGGTGYRFRLPDDSWYTYDEYVLPEHRKGGILRRMLETMPCLPELRSRNRNRVLIRLENEPSRIAHERFGFRKIRRILVLRLFSWSWIREAERTSPTG